MMCGRACTQLPPKSTRVHARNAVRADGPSRVHYLPSVRSVGMLEPSARHDGSAEPSAFTVLATKDHQAVTTRKRRRTPQDTPPTPLQLLGATIRQYRRQCGLTQEVLAAHTGLSLTYISEVERGRRNVSVLALLGIAAVLQVPVATLLQPLETRPELFLPSQA
jgi:DNA-binding XRE family transcriptional regulator